MKWAGVQETLEHRILRGLSCEWDVAVRMLDEPHGSRMRKPLFALGDFRNRLGQWSPEKREITLSRNFVLNHSWNDIREVLRHEMAHQFVTDISVGATEPAHGPRFQAACRVLTANPGATAAYTPLSCQISQASESGNDRLRLRIQKLMALAQSSNRHEAEAAMIKAHALTAKYEVAQMAHQTQRDYFSIFLGKPSLRHRGEDYALAHLLMDHYFVKGIWVSAYVLEKAKMGRVLEISGTARNLQMAAYVFDLIRRFIEIEWGRYNGDGKLNRSRKSDFATGILAGFRMKLEQKTADGKKSMEAKALVPVSDIQLHRYVSLRYPRLETVRRRGRRFHPQVMSDGTEVGKNLVIRKGISQADTGCDVRFLVSPI